MFDNALLLLSAVSIFGGLYLLLKNGRPQDVALAQRGRKLAIIPLFIGIMIQMLALGMREPFYEKITLAFAAVIIGYIIWSLNTLLCSDYEEAK